MFGSRASAFLRCVLARLPTQALREQRCVCEERAEKLVDDFEKVLQLVIDVPAAKRVSTLRGAALVGEEAVGEELAASGGVGFFIFASQLDVVRRERLKLAVKDMLAELLTQLIDESWIRTVRTKALSAIAAWRQEDGAVFSAEVSYRGIAAPHSAPLYLIAGDIAQEQYMVV